MSKNNVVKLTGRDTITDPLTELLRTGAEQLIYQAVEAAPGVRIVVASPEWS